MTRFLSLLRFAVLVVAAAPSQSFSGTFTCCRPLTTTRIQRKKATTTTTTTCTCASVSASTPDNVQIVTGMPEPLPNPLKHQYYLLRHGQSTANVAAIISSDRSNAYSERHGLTQLGREQAAAAATALVESLEAQATVTNNKNSNSDKNLQPGDKLTFVSSPFARAKQTAEECLEELLANDELLKRIDKLGLTLDTPSSNDIILKDQLMERYFGRLDNEAIYTYAYVWPLDKFNVTHTAFGVESVAAVCTRLRQLIVNDLEESLAGKRHHVVLTSHADVLQIAQLYACGAENVGAFSSYRFGNGEVRHMARYPDSLPDPVPLQAPKRGTQV